MTNHHDLIIIGGGCAGLSLAARLSGYGSGAPRTLVVDSRAGYTNDRTWCFWRLPGTVGAELAQHEWREFRVAGAGREEVVDCTATPYCAIPGDRFYEASLAAVGRSGQVELVHHAPVYGAVGGGPDVGRWRPRGGVTRPLMWWIRVRCGRRGRGMRCCGRAFWGRRWNGTGACLTPGG